MTLDFALLDTTTLHAWPLAATRFHLQLYGAGHVGRAIAQALAPLRHGVPGISGKEPEAIAISVAAQLLQASDPARTASGQRARTEALPA